MELICIVLTLGITMFTGLLTLFGATPCIHCIRIKKKSDFFFVSFRVSTGNIPVLVKSVRVKGMELSTQVRNRDGTPCFDASLNQDLVCPPDDTFSSVLSLDFEMVPAEGTTREVFFICRTLSSNTDTRITRSEIVLDCNRCIQVRKPINMH